VSAQFSHKRPTTEELLDMFAEADWMAKNLLPVDRLVFDFVRNMVAVVIHLDRRVRVLEPCAQNRGRNHTWIGPDDDAKCGYCGIEQELP
jgi:hypothetical protein